MNMALRKLPRSCRTPDGWRLATVEEAKDKMEWIKQSNLLEEWDRARLLDGWIGGSGYDFNVQEASRSLVGYMLVIESASPEIINTDDRNAVLYSEVHELSREGRSAALLLCTEDWNKDVLCWLTATDDPALWECDETEAAIELVSMIAREWQGVRVKNRMPTTEFSLASLEVLRIDILDLYNAFAVDIKESVNDLMINNQNSEQGKITNGVLAKWLPEIPGCCEAALKYLGLSENLEMFENYRFDTSMPSTWNDIAETVLYYAETFLVSILCSSLYNELVMLSEPKDKNSKRPDGFPTVVFLLDTIYDFFELHVLFDRTEEDRRAAEVEAESDFQRFAKILRDQCFSIFSSKGKSDVFSTVLVLAAGMGDINMVKAVIKCAVHLSEIDGQSTTALHCAARLDDESIGLEIAEMLLKEDESLANALGYEKSTPLYEAAGRRHAEMCRLLLQHNSSITSKDDYGRTPLHLASRENNVKVVRVLIPAVREASVPVLLVDVQDNFGYTPLRQAIEWNATVITVALLLSVSGQPQSYIASLNHPLVLYLREFSRLGLKDLVQTLVDEGVDPFDADDEGKTALHYAAKGEDHQMAEDIIKGLLFDKKGGGIKWEKASVGDKYGRNVLHLAAFVGNKKLCRLFSGLNRNMFDTKDRDGQSAVYYAVAGPLDDHKVLKIILQAAATKLILVKDFSQTTPLHVAAARGKLNMMETLLSEISEQEQKKKYVEAADVLGQTALHKAASGGHWRIVEKLLEEGADPLKERDCDGKTALHFAAKADGEDAVKIAELLLNNCKSEERRSLLLFACASEIGLNSNSSLEEYLQEKERKIQDNRGEENLLRVAGRLGDVDIVRELISRGADIDFIRNEEWIDTLPMKEEKTNVRHVVDKIKDSVEQGTDKPALKDHLGRNPFAIGLAALYLNPFVKSPVTVGISGEWGMGKSSVMVQTERILLKKAAQLSFTSSFQESDIIGANECTLSVTGKARRRKIANALDKLDGERCVAIYIMDGIGMSVKRVMKFRREVSNIIFKKRKKQEMEQSASKISFKGKDSHIFSWLHKFWSALRVLWEESEPFRPENVIKFNNLFEKKYQLKYHQILKSLAVIDRHEMFEEKKASSGKQTVGEMQGTTPSILTVQYNAWHYKNETEAWAGLAVKITEEFEATMTVAHKLRTSWTYNWTNRRDNICLKVIFPFFLQLLVAIFLSVIVWLVFGTAHNKDIKKLKYGGVPASLIVAAWGLGKSVVTFVKPISSQVVDYICLPDHSQKLGYHQKVIDDILFLKKHLSYKPSWIWKVFSFIWCCITWRWYENYVPGTKIRKMTPASDDNLRIIVFVDDLDRCEENVIIQVLSAVNLVLATCHINVIMSMENSMIQRAIVRKYGDTNSKANNDKSNEDLADKYLRKIVQIPLRLPDPSDEEASDFLQCQLGIWDSGKGSTGPVVKTEEHTRKDNPKFQIGTSITEKPKLGRGETKKDLAKIGTKQQKAPSVSDTRTTQQQLPKMEQKEATEKPERASLLAQIFNFFRVLPCLSNAQLHQETTKGDEQEGFEAEDATIEIQETADSEQSTRRDEEDSHTAVAHQGLPQMEQIETTKKEERAALIRQIFSYVCALPCLCNVQSHDETTKGDEQEGSRVEEAKSEKQETTDSEQSIKTDEEGDKEQESLSLLISATVIPNYTPGERNAFQFLQTRCTRSRKLPREWKSLMAYHRLAWNIMYLSFYLKYIDPLEGWQVQLIAWIFVCWQWRDLMTTLMQKWNKLKAFRNWKGKQGPSLREIVEVYIDEKWPADKKSAIKEEDNTIDNLSDTKELEKASDNLPQENTAINPNEEDTEGDEWLKKILKEQKEMREVLTKNLKEQEEMREALRKVQEDTREVLIKVLKEQEATREIRDMLEMVKKKVFKEEEEGSLQQGTTVKEESSVQQYTSVEEEREEWIKLRNTLRRFNVSMDGIQAFQKFRFFCEPGHLLWPLPEEEEE